MKKFLRYFGRTMLCLFTVVVLAVVLLIGTVIMLEYGPSETARNIFVNSAMESSAGKFLATMFLGEEKVEEIMAMNSVGETDDITDSTLVKIESNNKNDDKSDDESNDKTNDESDDKNNNSSDNDKEEYIDPCGGTLVSDEDGIKIIEISGSTYNAHIALIDDPSRVFIGTCPNFGDEYNGMTVKAMMDATGAVLGVNGGGFDDPNGTGKGATPIGIVIRDGELAWGNENSTYEVIGFDKNHVLVVGNMTGKQALERGIESALSFGPILIVNGKPTTVYGYGSGVNPRTAVGQAADGTVILASFDGRQANSIGATMSDIIEVLLKYGAVNGANLDGGSSCVMYYKGEYINNASSFYGARNIATSILVK